MSLLPVSSNRTPLLRREHVLKKRKQAISEIRMEQSDVDLTARGGKILRFGWFDWFSFVGFRTKNICNYEQKGPRFTFLVQRLRIFTENGKTSVYPFSSSLHKVQTQFKVETFWTHTARALILILWPREHIHGKNIFFPCCFPLN